MLTNFVKHKIVLAPNVSAVVNVVAPVVQLTEHAVSKVFVAKNAPVASAAEWLTAIVFAKKKINKYINKMIGEYMNSFINWLSKRDSKVYKEVKSFYEVDASQSGMGIPSSRSHAASSYARMNANAFANLMRVINNRSISSSKLDEIIKSLESAEEQLLHQQHDMESQGKLAEFNDYKSKIEKALEAAHDRWEELNP